MDKHLLCYAFGRDDQWEAICVDFDLSTYGSSFQEVQDGLSTIIDTYVQDALSEDSATAKKLLSRRAPFHVRLRLATKLLWNLLLARSGSNGRSYAGFDIPCHV